MNVTDCTLKRRLLELPGAFEELKFSGLSTNRVEMATAQRTRPRAVVGAPRRAAWQLKSALRHSISAAPRRLQKCFYIFFTIIVGDFLFMNNNG